MANLKLAQELVAFLNYVHKLDPEVLPALITHRVPCNMQVAMHPMIQTVESKTVRGLLQYKVGILGLLNGFCEAESDGTGGVEARFDADDKLVKFIVVELEQRN